MNSKVQVSIIAALVFSIISGTFLSCKTGEPVCDRPCLVFLMEQYLQALVAHDPSGLPLADNVRTVENTERIDVGNGLWMTATAEPTEFEIYVADPVAGEVGFIGVIEENNLPTIVALRLKLVEGKITEIDHLVVHNQTGDPLSPNMAKVRPAFLQPQFPSERVPREQMYEAVNLYYEAVVQDNGSIAPFAEDCQRRENGRTTARKTAPEPGPPWDESNKFDVFARMGCSEQMDTGIWNSITEIDHRRILAIDEEMGLVFAFSELVHDGTPEVLEITGVPGITEWPNEHGAFDLQAAHIFKIRNGRIHEIEAIGYKAPHGVKSGWKE
jgi:hypothetical protein